MKIKVRQTVSDGYEVMFDDPGSPRSLFEEAVHAALFVAALRNAGGGIIDDDVDEIQGQIESGDSTFEVEL